MSRRSLASAATTALAALTLAACGGGDTQTTDSSGADASGAPAAGATYQIGITQIVSHPSLDAAREGFKQSLTEAGVQAEFEEQNAQGDQATATSIAQNFAGKDLVLAIATPTAQAAAQVISDKPILFTAVTDPVAAGLVKTLEAPGANVTGTSDLNPVAEQIGLVKEIAPDAQSVGIVYSSGEVNSEVQVEMAQEAAQEQGLTVQTATVSNSGEVAQAANSLDVDAFYIPTDNTVVSAIESVISAAESQQVPVVAGEGDSVRRGAMATYGIDYTKLGAQTGQMAAQVLGGTDPASMPVQTQETPELVVNPAAAERAGVTLPAALVERADEVVQ